MIELLEILKSDINNHVKGGFLRKLLALIFSVSLRMIINYRIGNFLHHRRNFINNIFIMWLKKRQLNRYASDISYHATIGKNIKFPHPTGIVIGDGVVINDNVMVFQQVTFGSHGKKGKKLEYPIIEKGVKIYAGAKIIGGITIGENAIIGANTVVNIDVPPDSIAAGIPCKIIKK